MTTSVSCSLSESLTPTDWIARASRLDTGAWLADTALSATGGFTAACGTYAGPVMITTYPNIGVRWAATAASALNSYVFPTNCSTTPYFFKATTSTPVDPYFSSVKLLLHCNGTNGSTTFTDVIGHTLTAAGGVTISTAQSKFGSASGVSTAATGSALSASTSADFGFGTGDFTVEMFIYYTSTPAADQLCVDFRADATGTPFAMGVSSADTLLSYDGTTVRYGGALTHNAWNYITWTRASNVNVLGVGGTSGHTWTASQNFGSTNPVRLFANASATPGQRFAGYIDEVRITKGVARDVSSTPTVAFIDVAVGTTGGSEPSWDTTTGNTTVDGMVTWTCMGPLIQPITQCPLIAA
jgi:hypothetical protein